jgi:hypothetical protein
MEITGLLKMAHNQLMIDDFTLEISRSWNKAIESIINTSKTIERAENQLDRASLNALKRRLEQDRIMSNSTFSKLAKIASNPVLTSPQNMQKLPRSYATLYEIAQHDTKVVQDAIDQGKLHAAIMLKDISAILPNRPPNRIITKNVNSKISVSIRFSANDGDIPHALLSRLHEVLTEIEDYAVVNQSGIII